MSIHIYGCRKHRTSTCKKYYCPPCSYGLFFCYKIVSQSAYHHTDSPRRSYEFFRHIFHHFLYFLCVVIGIFTGIVSLHSLPPSNNSLSSPCHLILDAWRLFHLHFARWKSRHSPRLFNNRKGSRLYLGVTVSRLPESFYKNRFVHIHRYYNYRCPLPLRFLFWRRLPHPGGPNKNGIWQYAF